MDTNRGNGPSTHRSSVGEAHYDPSLLGETRTQAPAWLLATAAVLASFLLIALVALAASRLDRPVSDERATASGEQAGAAGKRVVDVERSDDGTAWVTLEDGTKIEVSSRPDGLAEFRDPEGNEIVLRPDPNGDIVGVRVDEDGNIVPIHRGEPIGDDAILFGTQNGQGGAGGAGGAGGQAGDESLNIDPDATHGPTVLIFDDDGNLVEAQPPAFDPSGEPGSTPGGVTQDGDGEIGEGQNESAQRSDEGGDGPGLTLVLLLVAGVLSILVVLAVAGALIRRNTSTSAVPPTLTPPPADPSTLEMVGVVEDLISRIRREPDPGRAIRLAYAHAEEAFANVAHLPRLHSETPTRYLDRILADRKDLDRPLRTLTDLFLHARYANHPLHEQDKEQAIMALDEIRRRLLQPMHDEVHPPDAVVSSAR